MTLSEAIFLRRSVRTYNGLKLDRDTLARLQSVVDRLEPLFPDAPLPAVKIVDGRDVEGRMGTYGVITGARLYMIMAVAPGVEAQVQAGYMFEQLILAATAANLGTCWLGGTFRRSRFAETMGDCGDREVEIVSPVGHGTPKRRLSERLLRHSCRADHRRAFGFMFRTVDGKGHVDPDSPVGRALQAVRMAPSSSNSQPWRATVDERPDGSTVVTFRCTRDRRRFTPTDMGIAYCHFVVSLRDQGIPFTIDASGGPLALRFTVGSR